MERSISALFVQPSDALFVEPGGMHYLHYLRANQMMMVHCALQPFQASFYRKFLPRTNLRPAYDIISIEGIHSIHFFYSRQNSLEIVYFSNHVFAFPMGLTYGNHPTTNCGSGIQYLVFEFVYF